MEDASNFRLISNLRKSTAPIGSVTSRASPSIIGADLEKPWNELPEDFRQTMLYGSGGKKINIEFESKTDSSSSQR